MSLTGLKSRLAFLVKSIYLPFAASKGSMAHGLPPSSKLARADQVFHWLHHPNTLSLLTLPHVTRTD